MKERVGLYLPVKNDGLTNKA